MDKKVICLQFRIKITEFVPWKELFAMNRDIIHELILFTNLFCEMEDIDLYVAIFSYICVYFNKQTLLGNQYRLMYLEHCLRREVDFLWRNRATDGAEDKRNLLAPQY